MWRAKQASPIPGAGEVDGFEAPCSIALASRREGVLGESLARSRADGGDAFGAAILPGGAVLLLLA